MKFRRWVVFTFIIHALVVVTDKSAGLVLYFLTKDRAEDHGAASLLASLPFILMAVANMGLATSLVYHVRRGLYTAQQAIESTLVVALIWGGFVAAGAFAVTEWVVPLLRDDWKISGWVLLPICLGVPPLLVLSYANSVQLSTERIRGYNLVHLFNSLLFLPLFLLAWWFSGKNAPMGVAWGRLGATLLVMVVALWMLRGVVKIRPKLHRGFLVDNVRYGWKANVSSVFTYLNHRIDLYMVGILFVATSGAVELRLGAEPALTFVEAEKAVVLQQVAFYSMAVTFAEIVWHFPEAMRDLFFSKVAGSSHEKARELTPVLVRLSATVSLVAGLGIVFTVDPIMCMVTEWLPGKTNAWVETWSGPVFEALLWLVPGTVAFTVAKVIQADMMARNLPNPCIQGCIVVFVVMIGLDLAWIPESGATGAAQASSVAYIASSLFMLWAYSRDTGVPWVRCLVPTRSDLGYLREILGSVWAKVRRKRR